MQKEFNDFVKQNQDSFNNFKTKTQEDYKNFTNEQNKEYDKFVKEIDSAYSTFLKKTWKEYNLFAGTKPDETPKLVGMPVFDPKKIVKTNNAISAKEPEKIKNPNFIEPSFIPSVSENLPKNIVNTETLDFYGNELHISFDKKIPGVLVSGVNEGAVSEYWKAISDCEYQPLLNQILKLKAEMNLNDWGYYLLIKKVSEKIFPGSENSQNLFTWFMLSKSRYKARVGYFGNKICLLIPSYSTLYGFKYYTFNNLRYYVINSGEEKIFTFSSDYPEANLIMDPAICNSLNICREIKEKQIKFNNNINDYSFTLKYNLNNVEFYKDYPLCDLTVYFNAPVSSIAKESLAENLYPLIKNKPEYEAVGLLLGFVQNAFPYKTDKEQFGKEKYFFPEEMFYYPYSDCEDRAALFAYLVKEFLQLEVIGLKYQGHVCTGVKLNKEITGDYILFNKNKYYICDPSFNNAPLGKCMPKFKDKQAQIIELENFQAKEKKKEKIWTKVITSGGCHGGNKQDIVFDKAGNSYVTGYFNGTMNLGSFAFKSTSGSNDIFIAKYDKAGNVLWAKQIGGKGNDLAYYIRLDNNDNFYITGTYDSTITIGSINLTINKYQDHLVAKYTKDGNLLWANKADIEKYHGNNINFIAKYNSAGIPEWTTKIYDEKENFETTGVVFDGTDNCYLIGYNYGFSGSASDTISYNDVTEYDIIKLLKKYNDLNISKGFESSIAGLFAVIQYISINGNSITGKIAQQALNTYNPQFKIKSPSIYAEIGKLEFIKNTDGIISIKTIGNDEVKFAQMVVENNAKLKAIKYKSENYKIDIFSKITVGKAAWWYILNYIDLYKETGNLLFDYDTDHTKKTMNLKKDILF